jgi:hypothetical protein
VGVLMKESFEFGRYMFLELILLGMSIAIFSWLFANIPEFWKEASFYWVLAVSSITLLPIINLIVPNRFEKPVLTPPLSLILFLSGVVSFLLFILFSGVGYQAVGAPTFQIIELGGIEKSFISGLAGIVEDGFFFYILPFLFFGVVLLVGRLAKTDLSFTFPVFFVITATFTFTVWHFYRYGLTNLPATISVLIFGFINSVIVFLTRQLIFTHILHFVNNFSATIFKYYTPTQVLFVLFSSPIFVVFMIITIVITIRRLRMFRR